MQSAALTTSNAPLHVFVTVLVAMKTNIYGKKGKWIVLPKWYVKGRVLDCEIRTKNLNLLKPTVQVMHQQFNIQQLHVLPTLYLCVLYLSENKQRFVPLTA